MSLIKKDNLTKLDLTVQFMMIMQQGCFNTTRIPHITTQRPEEKVRGEMKSH